MAFADVQVLKGKLGRRWSSKTLRVSRLPITLWSPMPATPVVREKPAFADSIEVAGEHDRAEWLQLPIAVHGAARSRAAPGQCAFDRISSQRRISNTSTWPGSTPVSHSMTGLTA